MPSSGGYEVDFWIIGSAVIIECDGWSAHGADHDQFEFDRIRDADLLSKGVITLRVTWRQTDENATRRGRAHSCDPRSVVTRRALDLSPVLAGCDLGATLDL